MSETDLRTATMAGLHDYVLNKVLVRFVKPGDRAIDLGAGSGALAMRMQKLGWDVTGADMNVAGFKAPLPFVPVDLNDRDFSREIGERQFSMVTAVEVIEHVEAPIALLRNGRRLLKPGGHMVITTPNIDSVPARVKSLLTEKIRKMDALSEPTHISPIFWDLFERQFLPLAGINIHEQHLVPPNDFISTRPRYSWITRGMSWIVSGACKFGDNHFFVLKPREA